MQCKQNIFRKIIFFFIASFAIIVYGCTKGTGFEENKIDNLKVQQVISMVDATEAVLGMRSLNNFEKAYAWSRTISDESSKMHLNENQKKYVSELINILDNPLIFDKSVKSEKTINSKMEVAKTLFNELDYFILFERLASIEQIEKVSPNFKKAIADTKKAPSVKGARLDPGLCNCRSKLYCHGALYDTCFFDERQCYSEGSAVMGCGFFGNLQCDGICGNQPEVP